MEDNFALTWEDPSTVVQSEEVICSIENEILPGESEEFTGVVCSEQTAETTTTIEQNIEEHEEYEEETEEMVNDSVQEEVEEEIEEVEENVGEVEEVVMGDDQQIVQEVIETVNNETEVVHQENIVYLTDDNVIVMESDVVADEIIEEIPITTNNTTDTITTNENDFQQHFMDCQVSEDIVTEQQWDESCPEEIVVGSEEAVGGTEEQTNEDFDIPLPTDQDEYTASRPYPCDFCSRRFRKKANLMNHMVAHQTDRPHGCNLCGVRYIRRCDLMNHLKIHAYVPETDGIEEDETQQFDESDQEKRNSSSSSIINNNNNNNKKIRSFGKRTKKKIKDEYDNNYENDETGASSSKSYNYVDEDMRLMEAMQNNVKTDYNEYNEYMTENQTVEVRYPITDPRKPFVCQHCGVGFAREKALASHARIHGGDSPFECQKCGEMFWDLALMREHIRTKHGGDIDDLIDENDVDDDDNDEDDDYSDEETKYGTFYCSVCGLSFHRQDNLKRHQRVHIKEEYVNDHEFGHICNVCGESFPEALDLLAHAEIHARTSEHRCMICGEICNDDQSVAVHVQTKHGKNLPPNTCMLCGRTCKDRRTLLKHSWEHSKEKSFACSKCAKTFHNKARLKRHMLSHRNKVVSCDVCGEEFPDGRSLMNHRHSHSSLTGRQFPCRECGKTFGSRSSQQIHIRIHTGERPYGCRFCWKAFADGGTLRKHERIHTGEKPYACAVCPRAFNQRVVLREHIRSHHSGPDPKYSHSVTPYCCSVCSDMFATSQDLIVHLIHHCDMNTAMKRQPQVGPRKYKRRRKLKPHELEMISNKVDDEMDDDDDQQQQQQYNQQQDPQQQQQQQQNIYSDSEDDRETRRKSNKKTKKYSPKSSLSESYNDFYNSCTSTIENINSIVNSKTTTTTPVKTKRKIKNESSTGGATTASTTATTLPSRPKMIHTQKTRVPVETGEDGKVRHKTKTLITRTQPTELKSSTGERIRPRTKNVSYHILNNEKLPIATFPEDDQAVNNLLKEELNVNNEQNISNNNNNNNNNGDIIMEQQTEQTPEVASEQIVESDNGAFPTNIIKVTSTPTQLHNLRPGRHLIVPYNKVRLVKGGMIVTKTKEKERRNNNEPENILPDVDADDGGGGNNDKDFGKIKQEIVDPSPLHELAEISMQHAQNIFKCEMCSAVFSDRGKLLDHVPIHI